MAKNYKHIIQGYASRLDKAVNYLRNALGDAPWIHYLSDAANDIRTKNNGVEWTVEVTDMDLPIVGAPMHLKPQSIAEKLKMFVSIKMTCSAKLWEKKEDCITDLCFKVSIQEIDNLDTTNVLQTGFHIDRTTDNEKFKHDEMHPLYHLHFLNESIIGGKETLSMDIPRLAHHPVDLFLGLMIVFANYDKNTFDTLKDDPNFSGLCKESADHYIEPYLRSLSKLPWGDSFKNQYDKDLCPYLVL